MKVEFDVPDSALVQVRELNMEAIKNKVIGIRQSKAAWTIKRYLIIGAASAAAGIASDTINRLLTSTGTDNRLMTVQSVPNNNPTHVRNVR